MSVATQLQSSDRLSELAPKYARRRRLVLQLLPWIGLVLAVAAFLTLDWIRSAAIGRVAAAKLKNCGVHDPVRHHAFAPNCTATYRWGGDSYQFATNSLGFRDEQVREVPLADSRPRLLFLGDSMTEGKVAWHSSFVGRIADRFPQYDVLNGGVSSYSPSNYFNVTRMVLDRGVEIDEVLVFIDISDVQDEATYYRDADGSGAVRGPEPERFHVPLLTQIRMGIARHFLLTNYGLRFLERELVAHGFYHLNTGPLGDAFDMERGAWTYRQVDETHPYYEGYAPLGVEAGIAREKAKMDRLYEMLAERHIPLSVVVYPHPAQIVHDTADSRQVRIWSEWCEGKCKRFLSLFPDILAIKDQCPRLKPGCWYLKYFVFGDIHYNAAGNVLLAEPVVRSISEVPPVKVSVAANAAPSTPLTHSSR
jgi:hypothetical protein